MIPIFRCNLDQATKASASLQTGDPNRVQEPEGLCPPRLIASRALKLVSTALNSLSEWADIPSVAPALLAPQVRRTAKICESIVESA